MALNKQQQNIVNPYPEEYDEDGRKGSGYNYDDPRNEWVISGIHDTYISFGTFSTIGHKLSPIGPIENTDESRTISVADALAYAALYPQNAIVKSSRAIIALPGVNPNRLGISRVTEKSAIEILNYLAERMQGIYNIATVTTKSSQKLENQATNTLPEADQSTSAKASQLPAIESTISPETIQQIRVSFGNAGSGTATSEPEVYIVKPGDWLSKIAIEYNVPLPKLIQANPQIVNPDLIHPGDAINIPLSGHLPPTAPQTEPINSTKIPKNVKTEHNAFTQAPPEDPNPEPYYNLSDKRWYYVHRTNAVNPSSYDRGKYEGSAPVRENFRKLIEKGTFEILKASGKIKFVSPEKRNELEETYAIADTFYGDPGRPHSGTGRTPDGTEQRPTQKRWIVSVSIDGSQINNIQPTSQYASNTAQELTSRQIMKQLLQSSDTSRNAPFLLSVLKDNLKHVVQVLRLYAKVLHNEGMTPELMSGLNLESEAEHVNSLYAVIEKWLAFNKITTTPKSSIEFLLDASFAIQSITVDGTLYPKGYGLKLGDSDAATTNIFANISPTTIAYMFYSKEIAKQYQQTATDSQMPWTKFITDYTWPNPIIYPAAVSRKKEEDRKKGKNKTSDDKKLFKTASEARRQSKRRLDITSKDLYNTIRSSAGSCGSAQTALLRDAIQVYQIFTGKTRSRDIIALVASKIRNELINDYLTQYKLTQLESFINNPAAAVRAVEEEVNKQLFCVIDVIGDVIDKQVLKPGGVPPVVRTLVADAIVPPKGVKFSQSPTTDFMAPWRKKLEQLVFEFIKQMILSVLGDVVKAALGCGPDSAEDESDRSKGNLQGAAIDTYGNIQINLLVDSAEDIDLIRIATDSKLINRYSRRNNQNQKIVVEQTASLDQLRQFNRDVSNILLMTETTALLEGNSSARTIGIINEMVNKGHADLTGLSDDDKTDILILAERQESLKRGDPKYASLIVTPEKIIQYFSTIGSSLSGTGNLLPEVDPKEAFCNAKDPDIPVSALSGLSEAQLVAEVEGQINAKLEQVKSLCELAKDNFSFQLEINNFMDALPMSGYYDKFLKYMSDASNAAMAAAQAALAAQVDAPASSATRIPTNQTQLYTAADQFYSTQKSRISVAIANPEGDFENAADFGDQRDRDTPDIIWTTGNKALNQMFIRFGSDNNVSVSMNIFPNGENTLWADAVREDLFTFRLAEDNTPLEPRLIEQDGETIVNPNKNNYSLVPQQQYTFVPNSLHGIIPNAPSRLVQAPEPADFINSGPSSNAMRGIKVPSHIGTSTSTNNYNPSLVAAANVYLNQAASLQQSPELANISANQQTNYRFSALFNNQQESFRDQITTFWLSESHKERMMSMSKAIIQPVIKRLDVVCITTKEQRIAEATIAVIQTRVANFMLNAGPLLRVYNGWNTPDTVSMIDGYLSYKIEKELRQNKMFDILLTGLDAVEKTMVSDQPKGQLGNYNNLSSTEEKFRYIVKETILGIFKSMREAESYASVDQNIFDLPDNNVWTQWYNTYSDYVYDGRIPVGGFEHPIETLEATPFHAEGQPIVWDNTADREAFRKISFLRYFPVPLLRGLQIIFYDRSINFLRSYAPFNFFAGQREAMSDDALISALNEQNMTVYSHPYVGFPVTIDNEVFYGYRDILNRITELDNQYEDIVRQELMFGSRTEVPAFEPNSRDGQGSQRILPPLPSPNAGLSDERNRVLVLTTPYGVLGVAEENYVSRAYPRQTFGFPRLRSKPGIPYNLFTNQSETLQLTLENKFGLADPAKGEGRRLQKLNYHDYQNAGTDRGARTTWSQAFEGHGIAGVDGAIYQVAWDSWITLDQGTRNNIIREALTTPYVSNLGVIETALDSPGQAYRDDLPLSTRFRPWAAAERQRLLYSIDYDVRGTPLDYNFLEAFAKYSNWAQDEAWRTADYEELFVWNNDDSVVWGGSGDTGYSWDGIKALFDASGTEWFFNFTTTGMADAMIRWYNGDAALFDDEDDVGDMPFRTRGTNYGAVLDKVGINHLYLKLAEDSAMIKPVVDRANLNSKINKLQAFYDKK